MKKRRLDRLTRGSRSPDRLASRTRDAKLRALLRAVPMWRMPGGVDIISRVREPRGEELTWSLAVARRLEA